MEKISFKILNYVQIAGNFKTGTSLLSSLLDAHPDVACFPGETGITGYLFPVLSDPAISKAEKIDTILDYRCGHQDGNVPVSSCDYAAVGRRFSSLSADVDNHFADLHKAFLDAFYTEFDPSHLENANVWVDKSPLSHLFADDVFSVFPSAKFIHLLRDPKDNFASVGASFMRRMRSRVKREALLWRYRVWCAQSFYYAKRNQDKFGQERYKVVRFRDIGAKPEEIVPAIARFIGIPELEILYQPTRAGFPYGGNNKNGLSFTGIYSGNIGRWKERIPSYYAQVMECQQSATLNRFKYEQYYAEKDRKRALRIHKILTTFIPKHILMDIFDARLFKSPASGVPGL